MASGESRSMEEILQQVYDSTNKRLKIGVNALDDAGINFGTGSPAKIQWQTDDANANLLAVIFPEGGATDVPVLQIGDANSEADLGFFNGLTEPVIAVINDAADAYARLDAGDDAVAGSKGLYFKAAADEDIELMNLSVTGTPRIFWDESEDAFSSNKFILVSAVGGTKVVSLSADHTLDSNSTTLQNVTGMLFAIAANEVWQFEIIVIGNSSAVADYKVKMAVPTGCTIEGRVNYTLANASHVVGTFDEATTYDCFGGGAVYTSFGAWGVAINGSTAGDVQLQAAQNTAEVSTSKIGINSYIVATRLA